MIEFFALLFEKLNFFEKFIEFKKIMKAKGVSQKTIVFNNMITNKVDFKYNWEINIMDSWLGSFMK